MKMTKDNAYLVKIIADDDNHLLRDKETPEEYEKLRAECKKAIKEGKV